MNILISNDDGIYANGIKVLAEHLSQFYDTYVIAPDSERSAAGHSITLNSPLRVKEIENLYGAKRAWAVSGTPGDCVKIGVNAILSQEEKPDLVISGINHGPNLGHDIIYSGTVSCAIEAAMMNIPSIAVSLNSYKPSLDDFKFSAEFIENLIPKLDKFYFPEKSVLNVNIPGIPKEDIAGVVVTQMGGRMFTDNYEKRIDPRGKVYYWMAGKLSTEKEPINTDIYAIRQNKISITPLTFNLTHTNSINDLNDVLCKNNLCEWF
ncbi:5'/3'-nucleotidase SurE [bacterium]|nr:5'/3'-nucleotidase SurE [bacterium]